MSSEARTSAPKRWGYFLHVAFLPLTVALVALNTAGLEGRARLLGILLLVLYGVWNVIEARFTVKDAAKGRSPLDKNSFELYALGRTATFYTAIGLPVLWREVPPTAYLGIALLICGALLRLQAIATLGRHYSHEVRLNTDHEVVRRGPYRFVRHPSYLGMLLAHLGLVLFYFNYVALGAFVGLFVPAVTFRILVEERALMSVPGYDEYSRRTKRLLPLLW